MKDFNYSPRYDGTIRITKYVGNAEEVEIPSMINGKNVTSIDDSTFEGCNTIKSVTIPNSVTTIGDRVFYTNFSLKSIDVSVDNSNYISENGVLFDKNKTKLIKYPPKKKDETYIIPDSVTTIGDYAFKSCNFTSITIPNSVTTIGNGAFHGCYSLTSITIPNSVKTIGNGAFHGCHFTSITIPNSVTTIGDRVFYENFWLKSIDVSVDNSNYISENGVLFDKNKTKLIQYPSEKKDETYIIPDSVTTIGDYAFMGCKSLISVTIPDSVTTIGNRAFELCTHLANISIPDSITTISDYAFRGCMALESVTIPDSVTTIGDRAVGYRWNICDRRSRKVKNFHIYCYKNTAGEKYAIARKFDYTLKEKPIKNFCDEFATLWSSRAKNKRFGQIVVELNKAFNKPRHDIYNLSDDEMMEVIRRYFSKEYKVEKQNDQRHYQLADRWDEAMIDLLDDSEYDDFKFDVFKPLFLDTWQYFIDTVDDFGIDNRSLGIIGQMYTLAHRGKYPAGITKWEFSAFSKIIEGLLFSLQEPMHAGGYLGNFYDGYISVNDWDHNYTAVHISEFDNYYKQLSHEIYEEVYADEYDENGNPWENDE